MAKKILVIAHGHPDHRPGGGEIAAYNLHSKLRDSDEFQSVFFARHDKRNLMHGGTQFCGNNKPGEVLFYSTMPDWFRFSQPDKSKIWRDFQQLLEAYKPDIVHFHHYLFLGLEFFRQVKNHNPETSIVLTLHEYMGMCHNEGQMIKKHNGELCHRASTADCSTCFPQYSAQDFFFREQFIKSHFSLVDHFISPSAFLANRYISWGLPADRFSVVENMLVDDEHGEAPVSCSKRDQVTGKIRFGFFGQINSFKGVDLLLDSVGKLHESTRQQIHFDINGAGLNKQPAKLRNRITRSIKQNADIVRLQGEYRQSELGKLMSLTDWVVMPSVWWENSPVVILEARKYGVPVLCSDIGGMAEKIEHGKTGVHFMARRAESLASQIEWIVDNRHQWPEFSRNIRDSYDDKLALDQHKRIYNQLLEKPAKAVELRAA